MGARSMTPWSASYPCRSLLIGHLILLRSRARWEHEERTHL